MIRMPFEDDCLRVLGRGGREPVRAIGRNVTKVELGEPRDRRELASYLGKYGQASLCSAVDGHSIECPLLGELHGDANRLSFCSKRLGRVSIEQRPGIAVERALRVPAHRDS